MRRTVYYVVTAKAIQEIGADEKPYTVDQDIRYSKPFMNKGLAEATAKRMSKPVYKGDYPIHVEKHVEEGLEGYPYSWHLADDAEVEIVSAWWNGEQTEV